MAPINPRITPSLQATLLDNPLIEEVHFDDQGNHHFNIYDEEEVTHIEDKKTGTSKRVVKKTGRKISGGASGKLIVKSMSAEDVIAAKAMEPSKKEDTKTTV